MKRLHTWPKHVASVSAPHNPQPTCRDGKPVPKPTLKHHVDTMHAADSTPPAFKMRVTGVYGGDATKRLVSEAVKIKYTSRQMNQIGRVVPDIVAMAGPVVTSAAEGALPCGFWFP